MRAEGGQIYEGNRFRTSVTESARGRVDVSNLANKGVQEQLDRNKQQALQLYEQGLNLSMSQNMSELYTKYENDPTSLAAEMNKLNEKMSAEIPDNRMRIAFKTNFLMESQSYVTRASNNFKRIQEKNRRDSLERSLIDRTKMLDMAFYNMLSPDGTPDDVTNFLRARESIKGILNSRNDDGTLIYSPSQQESVLKGLRKSQLSSVKGYFNNLPDYARENFRMALESGNATITGATLDDKGEIESKALPLKDFLDEEAMRDIKLYVNEYQEKVKSKTKSGKTPERSQEETIANLVALDELNTIKSSMQEKKQWKTGLKVGDFMDYRDKIKEYRINDIIDDKEYAKLMAETVNPLLDRINTYDPEEGIPDPYLGKVYMSVMKNIDPHDRFSPEKKAYILNQAYDMLLKKDIDPSEAYDSDNKNIIGKISSQIRQDYAVDLDPALLNKNVDKVIFGSNIYDYSEGKGIQNVKGSEAEYRKAPDGHIYKIVRNKYGEPINKILVR